MRAHPTGVDAYLGYLTATLEDGSGLEFVLYPLETVQVATPEPGFDLNLNTGRELPSRVDLAPLREAGAPDGEDRDRRG